MLHLNLSNRRIIVEATVVAALILSGTASADEHEACIHHQQQASLSAGGKATWMKSTSDYKMPDVSLVRTDGKKVSLAKEIDDGKPVILNFIYTSCTTVCPVMSQTFAGVQDRLGTELDNVHMVSISIDPEHDTPQRLKEYEKRYNVRRQWDFYTGTIEASIATQKAFDAYRGDKMNHLPVIFIRSAPGQPWVRMEGFASPDDIAREYRMLARQK